MIGFSARDSGLARLARSLIIVAVLALALLPVGVRAEEPLRFKNLDVKVWPEYDDPGVLVIAVADVPAGTSLPRTVSFRVPAGARVNSSCSIDASGTHNPQQPTIKDEDGYSIVSFQILHPRFDLEYYYDPLPKQADKSFTYSFQTLNPIDNLQIELQQPLKASSFTVSPAALSTDSDAEGFKYHRFKYTNVAIDRPVDLNIGYTKSDPQPSKPEGAQGQAQGAAGGPDNAALLLVLGLTLTGGAGYYAYRRSSRPPAAHSRAQARYAARHSTRPAAATARPAANTVERPATGGAGGRPRFCTQCGTRMNAGDRFCPDCGAPAKRS